MTKHNCQDCDEPASKLFHDPRDPPLDTGPCICEDCLEGAKDEVKANLQAQIDALS